MSLVKVPLCGIRHGPIPFKLDREGEDSYSY